MYLLNPIWAGDIPWCDAEDIEQPDFSEEIYTVAHRLSIMPFNELLYKYCRVNTIHSDIYHKDLIVKFNPSRYEMHPFYKNEQKHWVCSIGFGDGFNINDVFSQLKFLLKESPLLVVKEWTTDELLTPYMKELQNVKSVQFVSLDYLNQIFTEELE